MKAPGFEETGTTSRETRFGETSPSMRDAQTAYEAYYRHTGGKTHDDRPMPTWKDLPAEVRAAWAASAAAITKNAASVTDATKPPRGRVSDTGEPTPQERQQQHEERIRSSQQRAAERFRENPPTEPRHWERNTDLPPGAFTRGSPVGPPMPADPSLMHTPLSPPGSLSHPQGHEYAASQAVSPAAVAPPAMPHGGDQPHIPAAPHAPSVQVPTNQPKSSKR